MGNPILGPQYAVEHGVQTGFMYDLAWVSINGRCIWRSYRHHHENAVDIVKTQVSVANWSLQRLSAGELADEDYVISKLTSDLELQDALN